MALCVKTVIPSGVRSYLRRVRSRRETLTQPRWMSRLIYQFTLPTAIPRRADKFACVTFESCAISFRRAYSCCLISVMVFRIQFLNSHMELPHCQGQVQLIKLSQGYTLRNCCQIILFPTRAIALLLYTACDTQSLPGTRSSTPVFVVSPQ